eukprot:6554335-Lingulodinium_polyedra.AAC.1
MEAPQAGPPFSCGCTVMRSLTACAHAADIPSLSREWSGVPDRCEPRLREPSVVVSCNARADCLI